MRKEKTHLEELKCKLVDNELYTLVDILYSKLDSSDLEILYKIISRMEREAILKDIENIRVAMIRPSLSACEITGINRAFVEVRDSIRKGLE